jgi:hypothetical protein
MLGRSLVQEAGSARVAKTDSLEVPSQSVGLLEVCASLFVADSQHGVEVDVVGLLDPAIRRPQSRSTVSIASRQPLSYSSSVKNVGVRMSAFSGGADGSSDGRAAATLLPPCHCSPLGLPPSGEIVSVQSPASGQGWNGIAAGVG